MRKSQPSQRRVDSDHVARHRRDRIAINAAIGAMAERAAANAQQSADIARASRDAQRKTGAHATSPLQSTTTQKEAAPTSAAPKAETRTKRRWPSVVGRIVLTVFAIAALVLLCTEIWLFNNWAALSVDEILYHLRASLSGTNTSTIVDYVLHYGIVELVGAAAAIVVLFVLWRRFGKKARRIVVAAILAFGIGAAAYAIHDFNARVGAFEYFAQLTQRSSNDGEKADFVEANYVDPATTYLDFPKQKRNLIYIYLESMELTFADKEHGGAFPKNVIPELCALAEENECFAGDGSASDGTAPASTGTLTGAHALPGTTWTTGAMFGSTSGVPLKLPFNSAEFESGDDFFPTMQTLGDILAGEGYAQELLIGSEAAFGGRDLYYQTHGDFKITDYNYAIDNGMIPEDYYVWWGFEDRKLFSFARSELEQLAAADQPFNLTLLTVDTHFSDGWICPLCQQEFDEQYSNVYACSSRQVAQFVRWIQKQDFYDNTTIVITGDHPTMDADYCSSVPASYDRRVYTTVINPAPSTFASFDKAKRREYSTLDLFPTTLAALGTGINGNRLGLGTNLFSGEPTLIELYGQDVVETELAKPSAFLESFTDVQITAKHMADASDRDWLDVVVEDDGTLTFMLAESALNASAVNGVKIKVLDERTGFSRALATTMTPDEADPNYFYYSVHTNMTEEDLPYIGLSATISAGRFKNYPVCSLDPGQLVKQDEEGEDEDSAEGEDDGWYE